MCLQIINGEISINSEFTQIINGEEVNLPCPKVLHQSASGKLFLQLNDHVRLHKLGRIFFVPFDVIFEENFNILQPDLLYVSNKNKEIVQDWVRGVPDLTIEIVSPELIDMDTVIKKGIYERYGVPECWLVYPEKVCIEVYTLNNGNYSLLSSFSDQELVRSNVLDQLSFPANAIRR